MENAKHDDIIGSEMENSVYDSKTLKEEIIAPIGTTADGKPFCQDLSRIPHFLVCGFSGTGKTSFIQTIMAYLAAKYSLATIRFLVYDSKAVDYGVFNALPHLLAPVIVDGRKAQEAISWLMMECRRRLTLLADFHVRDIITYNKQMVATNGETLPQLFVVLDDFSSIIYFDDAIESLKYILRDGRPTGIHLILATSLTSSKILQKDILSSVPCRISFCVSTRADSRIAIDQNGAESLRVPGELIFRWQNVMLQCQGVYLPDDNIQKVIRKIQQQSPKSPDALGDSVAQVLDDTRELQDSLETELADVDEEDDQFEAAVACVIEAGEASTSLLQRRLRLGYARAGRLIAEMEARGIIGPHKGSKPHPVLITYAQWLEMKYKEDFDTNQYTVAENTENSEITPSTCAALAQNTNADEAADIKMRDFAQFSLDDISLCINDDKIKITNKVVTKHAERTDIASFNGKSIMGLIYRRPRIFSHGYIQFMMKPDVEIINYGSHLMTVTKDNLTNIMKIEFDSNNIAHTMKRFMLQIAQDTDVQLIEL